MDNLWMLGMVAIQMDPTWAGVERMASSEAQEPEIQNLGC